VHGLDECGDPQETAPTMSRPREGGTTAGRTAEDGTTEERTTAEGSAVRTASVQTPPVDGRRGMAPQEALRLLIAGNHRWVSGRSGPPASSPRHREQLIEGQSPFALTISCIDSRVPPELVFDRGLGELAAVRTAAHTLDEVVLGSLEFGPLALGTSLIMVMGHQRCGAVTAAVEAFRDHDGRAPGNIQAVVDALEPAYRAAVADPGPDLVDRMVRAQIRLTVARLASLPLLQPALAEGRLAIVGGYYSLESGAVSVLD
jgi:carbonic anhydrase